MKDKKKGQKQSNKKLSLKWAGDLLLSGFGGCLYALSQPAPSMAILAWISVVPLLFAIKDYRPYKALVLGFTFGVFANLGVFYWTALPASRFGGVPMFLGVLITILLVTYVSIYSAVFSAFVSWTREKFGLSEFVSVPISFVALEYLRGVLFTGFPWGFLGHSQIPFLPIIQILDITGIFGVTFAIAAVNAAIYLILSTFAGDRKKFPWVESIISITLVAILLTYGLYAIKRETKKTDLGREITVALIQGNIRQDLKWDPANQENTISIYEEMTLSAREANPDIIILPETATPFFFRLHKLYRPRVEALAKNTGTHLFFGTPDVLIEESIEGDRYRYFNSAYLLNSKGQIVNKYDKIHLVPFAEYVPLKKLFFFVDKIVQGVGDFMPGENDDPLKTDFGPVGTLICYEAIFPKATREYAKKGAVLIINKTNDAWFGKTSAPYQHFAMSRIRAVETRIPLVRSANTGITAIVHTTGRVECQTPIFKRKVVIGKVVAKNRLTFYTRFGDIFAQIVTLAFFLPFLIHLFSIAKGFWTKKRA